ncbi:hypothetical protein [Nocardia sp. NPDC004711]
MTEQQPVALDGATALEALRRAAAAAGADPAALLDSQSFRDQIANVDMTAAGAFDQLAEAARATVEQFPVIAAAAQQQWPNAADGPTVEQMLANNSPEQKAAARAARQERVQQYYDSINAANAGHPLHKAAFGRLEAEVGRAVARAEAEKAQREERDAVIRRGFAVGSAWPEAGDQD